jgi:hypothetical protein
LTRREDAMAGSRAARRGRHAHVIDEDDVKWALVAWASNEGWKVVSGGSKKRHGPDLLLRQSSGRRRFIIEVKGNQPRKSPTMASTTKDSQFVVALGQLVSRMDTLDKETMFGVAFPDDPAYEGPVERGRLPWQFAKRMNVSVLFVAASGRVRWLGHPELRRLQSDRKG